MSQSLDRGLRILDEIAAGRTTLASMSESLGVHKSTVMRLLATLQQHHFVQRDGIHEYALGRRLIDLGAFALESRDVVPTARPFLRRLSQSTGHSTYLAVYEEGAAVVVEISAARRQLQAALRLGDVLPLHATASGKVLLAFQREDERDRVLSSASFERYTDETRTALEDVAEEVGNVARSGFGLEVAEHERFVSAIGAPVFDSSGQVIAAIALTVPSMTTDRAELMQYAPQLLEACGEVSRKLGWQS